VFSASRNIFTFCDQKVTTCPTACDSGAGGKVLGWPISRHKGGTSAIKLSLPRRMAGAAHPRPHGDFETRGYNIDEIMLKLLPASKRIH